MKLKLFINKKTNTVLYAEAGKDFVDVLLHALVVPFFYAMKDISSDFISDGLAALYTNVVEDPSKASFLRPKFKVSLPVYCEECNSVVELFAFHGARVGEGYVKAGITYSVMDDLAVKPFEGVDVLSLLLSIEDLDYCIHETQVTICRHQIRELVKASLTSKTVLTDTFLPLKHENK